jgi:hypothetical protein
MLLRVMTNHDHSMTSFTFVSQRKGSEKSLICCCVYSKHRHQYLLFVNLLQLMDFDTSVPIGPSLTAELMEVPSQ